MFIKQISMEGFKCYEDKVEIKDLDRSFNAVTGLNGCGKSNVIDAIIFCLNLDTAKSMRASSLKDLINIHKKQATVTLTMANVPNYGNIQLTRVLTATSNKFKLNNTSCTKTTVLNLTKSMAISNNFIVLQGHITKMINMKPSELKMMIEETAGTKVYNQEYQKSLSQLEKKESQLKIAQNHLKMRIGPYFSQLQGEKKIYMQNQQLETICRQKKQQLSEVSREYQQILEKINFFNLSKSFGKYRETAQILQKFKENSSVNVPSIKLEIKQNQILLEELQQENSTVHVKFSKNNLEELNNSLMTCRSVHKALEDKEKILESQMSLENSNFQLKDLEILKKRQNTLEIDYKKIEIENLIEKYAEKGKKGQLEPVELIENLSVTLQASIDAFSRAKNSIKEFFTLRENLGYQLDNEKIYGTVDELFELTSEKYLEAVFTILGNRAKFLVVEDDKVATEILNNSVKRVSCIPLNRIIKTSTPSLKEKRLIDCIKFDLKLKNVFNFLFGSYFVFECKKEAALCCSKNKVLCVTLDGTVYDPRGTLTGGKTSFSRRQIHRKKEVLQKLTEVKKELNFVGESMGIKINLEKVENFRFDQLEEKMKKLKEALRLKKEVLLNRNKIEFLEKIMENKCDVRGELERITEEIGRNRKKMCFIEEKVKNANQRAEENERQLKMQEEVQERISAVKEKILDLKEKLENCSKFPFHNKNEILRENVKSKAEVFKFFREIRETVEDLSEEEIFGEIDSLLGEKQFLVTDRDYEAIDQLKSQIEELKAEVNFKRGRITMDPGNFQLLEKNALAVEELKEKIVRLEEDKGKIEATMVKLSKMGENENKKAFNHVNLALNRFIKYFFPSLSAEIMPGLYEIKVRSKTAEFSLGELSGGQRSIIALCLIFSMLSYKPAPFYIFDEIDAALDLSFTQHIGEIIRNEFKNAQFLIVSLKNNMFDSANKIYKVYIEDHKSKIKRIK